MTKLEKAMKISTNVIIENSELCIEELFTKLFMELYKNGVDEYYYIIAEFMIVVRNHFRRSADL